VGAVRACFCGHVPEDGEMIEKEMIKWEIKIRNLKLADYVLHPFVTPFQHGSLLSCRLENIHMFAQLNLYATSYSILMPSQSRPLSYPPLSTFD